MNDKTLNDYSNLPVHDIAREKALGDRILNYSFLASAILTIGWISWVAHSDIFSSGAAIAPMKETKIKVFHPIPQKPKIKPPKPPPPPPPPKQPPHVKPPPPLHIPRQQPRPQPVTHTIQVARTTRSTPNQISLPAVPDTPLPTTPFVPTATVQPTPPPTPVVPDNVAPTPPTPAPTPPAPRPEPVVEAPKPPPPVVHPRNYSPIDSQEAAPLGDYGQPDVPSGLDPSTLTSTTISISFEIDENGRATNIHITKHSGNADLDDNCKEVIRQMRFQPAIQDHLKLRAPASHDFNFG